MWNYSCSNDSIQTTSYNLPFQERLLYSIGETETSVKDILKSEAQPSIAEAGVSVMPKPISFS